MTPKISIEILDEVCKRLSESEFEKAIVGYFDDDKGIDVYARVTWVYCESENYITFDGRRYSEGTYYYICDFKDLEIKAWVDDKEAYVDIEYVEDKLTEFINENKTQIR